MPVPFEDERNLATQHWKLELRKLAETLLRAQGHRAMMRILKTGPYLKRRISLLEADIP
jgi:hypothetical protein